MAVERYPRRTREGHARFKLEAARMRHRGWRKEHAAQGLCRHCTNPVAFKAVVPLAPHGTYVTCFKHAEEDRLRNRRKMQERSTWLDTGLAG